MTFRCGNKKWIKSENFLLWKTRLLLFLTIFGIIYVFCFVLQLSSGDYEMYDSIDWLVYDSDKEEEYEAKAEFNNQTKTKELFIESNSCDIENENIRRIS